MPKNTITNSLSNENSDPEIVRIQGEMDKILRVVALNHLFSIELQKIIGHIKDEEVRLTGMPRIENYLTDYLSDYACIKYSRLKKTLIERHWELFEIARESENYELAVLNFLAAFEMGYYKAKQLFDEKLKENVNCQLEVDFCPDSADEMFFMGMRYKLGLGVPLDDEMAGVLFSKAFDIDSSDQQEKINTNDEKKWRHFRLNRMSYDYILGYSFENGMGSIYTQKDVVKRYERAAKLGHAAAQNSLGNCYENGYGVSKNPKKAVKWYRKAAQQGHAVAQNNLGRCYENGIGFRIERRRQSIAWYLFAAEQGFPAAQYNLGRSYWGTYVYHDLSNHVKWQREAAKQRHAEALQCLKSINKRFYYPVTGYTISIIEQKYSEALKFVLSDIPVSTESDVLIKAIFYQEDLIYILKESRDSIRDFLDAIKKIAQKSNEKINEFLINCLLTVNNAIETQHMECREEIADFMTGLISEIKPADAKANQVKDLINYYLHVYLKDPSQDLLRSIISLWHRAMALEIPMNDSNLNKLMAGYLINHCFDGQYCLKADASVTEKDLAILVLACGMDNNCLSLDSLKQTLMTESKLKLENLLPKLRSCLSNSACLDGSISTNIQQLMACFNKTGSDNENDCSERFNHLCSIADDILNSFYNPRLFSGNKETIAKEEFDLLFSLKYKDCQAVLDWIERRENSLNNEHIIAASSS